MAPLSVFTKTVSLGAALLALGCTGNLGDPSQSSGGPGGLGADGGPVDALGRPLALRPLVLSRLSRAEYNNTVRDLFGTQLTPADSFPSDGMAAGFETVGSALSLSPTYVIAYEGAAHELTTELFASESAARAKILHCDFEAAEAAERHSCARAIVGDFARRAFRRPVTTEEVEAVLLPFRVAEAEGVSPAEGLRHSLAAVLMSPFFIFKLELDEDPTSTEPRRLDPYELASRLSYTLWSTLPDDELLGAAEAGLLATDEQISAHVDRMLDDPRSDGLLQNFAARWLEFKHLESHEVEASLFPDYDLRLVASMKKEALLFIRDFLDSGRPAKEMLTAGFTYLDGTMAAHYGLPAPAGDPSAWVRVETGGTARIGLLTLGALLTKSSFSSRTSPVRRGEFVFSHLLCGHIPPPPPGVEGLPADVSGLSLRERLELHRADPSCSGCHNVMDPLGFGLENYDAIGRYRTQDGTSAVDASGELPGGVVFDGVQELSEILVNDPRVSECITKKFMIYAGRRLVSGPNDNGWVTHLTTQASEADGGSLRSIIHAMLLSEAFRSRVPSGT